MGKFTYIKDDIEFEKCVNCGKKLTIRVGLSIAFRQNYVEGAGQHCAECYKEAIQTCQQE